MTSIIHAIPFLPIKCQRMQADAGFLPILL